MKYIANEGLLVGRCISVVFLYIDSFLISVGVRGSVAVKALFYKPEGRGFDSR
jgi:hypothetical protein